MKFKRCLVQVWIMLLTVIWVAAAAPASAYADVRPAGLDDKGRFAYIDLTGEISRADVEQFRKLTDFLVPHFGVVTVALNSRGGDLFAAMEIGKIVRDNWIWTDVEDEMGTECSSACVFVFAAGAQRIAGDQSLVRIHRPHFAAELFGQLGQPQAKAKYDGLIDQVRNYLSRMGMSEQLFQAMMAIRSNEARTLTLDEMKAMNLVGEDPGYAEWMRAKNALGHVQQF